MDLVRRGNELVLTVGDSRRLLALPAALWRCEVVGAELVAGRLSVRFGTPEDSAKSVGRRSAPSPRPAHELDRSGGVAAEAVGTAAEEAAKLIASLTSWVGDHIATDAEECQLCPICLLIRSVRDANPDVVRHLAVAGL